MVLKDRRRDIEATATFDGKWWFVEIPELDTVGQARGVRDLDQTAREVAAGWLDVPEESLAVHVRIRVPDDAADEWARAQRIEAQARELESEAARLRRSAVKRMRAEKYTLEATARALGVSTSRAQQLAG